jgi:hypothetical protein
MRHDYNDDILPGYVPESAVTQEIREDLQQLGWAVINSDT